MDEHQKIQQLGKMLRKARGRLTTYEIAKCAGISTSELNAVENGEAWPSDDAWEKLAAHLGLPVDMLSHMKRPSRVPREIEEQRPLGSPKPPVATNVISLAAYQEKKWRQTSLFEKD